MISLSDKYCNMTAEGLNHEAATDSRCEMVGRVSMVTCG
jgi:hypothetical protein